MAERALLLGLMRKLRRRRRWSDAATGGAFAVAVCAPAIAAAIPLLRWRGLELPVEGVVAATAAGALAGALLRGMRRISLAACARAVDRALGPPNPGDAVFAAVSFAESGAGASPFIAALTADAWERARVLPAPRIVPGPARRLLILASVEMVALAALVGSRGAVPRLIGFADGGRSTEQAGGGERHRPQVASPLLRMEAAALDAEREDAATAGIAARAAADAELARLADEMARLLAELSGSGVGSESAVKRARALASGAHAAADHAGAAAAATKAVRAALAGPGARTGAAATELANAVGTGEAQDAAGRLAAEGASGRSALARAAGAAARALDREGGSGTNTDSGASAASDGAGQPGDDEMTRRRLDDGRAAEGGSPGPASASGGANQRQLQKLRRDLDRAAADCQRDPEACRRNARGTGRALDQLGRAGQTADARTRLAQSAQQLLDRLQRGGGGGGEARRLRSFSRAARAGAPPPPGTAARGVGRPEAGLPSGAGVATGEGLAPPAEQAAEGNEEGGGTAPSLGTEMSPARAGDSAGDEDAQRAAGTTRSDQGVGAAVAGSGIGSAPGGPVLGAPTPPARDGPGAGRDAPTAVTSAAQGPSRSAVIGGAASAGFASVEYRRVFTDYSTAVEESLDSAAVPPGRRYVVRRYFQLIRPRGP